MIIFSFFLYILQRPLLLFVLFNAMKIYSNLTLRHMGEFLLAWDKLQNLEVTFLKCFYPKKIMGWTSGLPEIMETSSAH